VGLAQFLDWTGWHIHRRWREPNGGWLISR
jgi:hypothetical protein